MSSDVRHEVRWATVAFGAVFVAAVLGSSLGGCKKEPKRSTEAVPEAEQGPAVDPALARVMASASASAGPARPGQGTDGPPETGVFGPGEADKQILRGTPAKLTLGGFGSEPRLRLTGLPPVGKSSLRVRVTAQRGNEQDVPVDVDLALEVTLPKAPLAAPAGAEGAAVAPPASAPMAAPAGREVTAKVAAAKVDATLVPTVPKDVEAAVAKLKGSRILFHLTESGAGTAFTVALAKDANPGLTSMMNSISDALAILTVPYPEQPVGTGAMWMATTREAVLGIDAVSYRLMKVRAIAGDRVTLEVNTRRYAADAHQVVPGITAEGALDLQKFQAEGNGVVEVSAAAGLPDAGTVQYGLGAIVLAGEQPRPMMLQEQVRVVIGSPALAAEPAEPAEPVGPIP